MADPKVGMVVASSAYPTMTNGEWIKPPFPDQQKKLMIWPHIFIVDENPARQRAACALSAQWHLEVVSVVSSVYECLAQLKEANCQLILVSATLPDDDVYKLFKHVRRQPQIKVIVTEVPNDPQQILPYISAGAAGYVTAQEGMSAWAKQLDAVWRGQPLVSLRSRIGGQPGITRCRHAYPRLGTRSMSRAGTSAVPANGERLADRLRRARSWLFW